MDKTKWIIFAGVVVLFFGGLLWFNRDSSPKFTGDASKIIYEPPIADHFVGSNEQKVVLIEYGDFQCPTCQRMYSTIKQLEAAYPDKLTVIYRNRPLTGIHPNALAAATAAEAAGLQGKFFEMHDLLFENQDAWSSVDAANRVAVFEQYAIQIGLDLQKFNSDLTSADITAKLARDRQTAETYGANSTPSFILNGQKLSESQSVSHEELTKAVQAAINQAFPSPDQPAQ